jgi:hypothetical protein
MHPFIQFFISQPHFGQEHTAWLQGYKQRQHRVKQQHQNQQIDLDSLGISL